ncbi:hypothetical protein BURPS305_5479 [Burkholderia pseudomallei 305]|nr:hypothetical protein BURPS305_5479 [Burkholderia pseudomallei 305]
MTGRGRAARRALAACRAGALRGCIADARGASIRERPDGRFKAER